MEQSMIVPFFLNFFEYILKKYVLFYMLTKVNRK